MNWRTTLSRSRGTAVTAAALAVVLILGVVLIVLSQAVGGSDEPPKAPPFAGAPPSPTSALDVKQRDGARLTLIRQKGETTEQQDLTLPESTMVERLRPIAPEDVRPGDWVTVFGIHNDVKNFAIHSVVVIPSPADGRVDGLARSAAGFFGHEASRDRSDRPIFGGIVESVNGKDLKLKVPTGTATVHIERGARFYRLEPSSAADIREGDRIAGTFTGSVPAAVLVIPNGGS